MWLADLGPTRGHEQKGRRPVLVISSDIYNSGPAGLAVIVPMTKKDRGIPMHVKIAPPDGGLKAKSFVMCDAVRSVSKDRLVKKWGAVSHAIMHDVEDRLRILLEL